MLCITYVMLVNIAVSVCIIIVPGVRNILLLSFFFPHTLLYCDVSFFCKETITKMCFCLTEAFYSINCSSVVWSVLLVRVLLRLLHSMGHSLVGSCLSWQQGISLFHHLYSLM